MNHISRTAPRVYKGFIRIQDGTEEAGPWGSEQEAIKGFNKALKFWNNGKMKAKDITFLDECPLLLDSEPGPWPPTAWACAKRATEPGGRFYLKPEDVEQAFMLGAPLDALRLEVLQAIASGDTSDYELCAKAVCRDTLAHWDVYQILNGIWSILCAYVGEREGTRGSFINSFTSRTCYEWRLASNLSAGSKFWRNDSRYYIEPYPEQERLLTGEDRRVVARVNLLLSRLPFLMPENP